jgi:hypothetical protein
MEATFVKDLSGWKGGAKLWCLSEPYKVSDWSGNEYATVTHVITSAVVAYSGPETYVFPSDASGEVVDFGELPGSFQGDLHHDIAIRGFCESAE